MALDLRADLEQKYQRRKEITDTMVAVKEAKGDDDVVAWPHNVPTLSRLTRPPEGENRPSVTGQRTVAQGWIVTV